MNLYHKHKSGTIPKNPATLQIRFKKHLHWRGQQTTKYMFLGRMDTEEKERLQIAQFFSSLASGRKNECRKAPVVLSNLPLGLKKKENRYKQRNT
jgi:hypothetical protein